jgi:hypothetical protein
VGEHFRQRILETFDTMARDTTSDHLQTIHTQGPTQTTASVRTQALCPGTGDDESLKNRNRNHWRREWNNQADVLLSRLKIINETELVPDLGDIRTQRWGRDRESQQPDRRRRIATARGENRKLGRRRTFGTAIPSATSKPNQGRQRLREKRGLEP